MDVGSNALAGTGPYSLVGKVKLMLAKDDSWENPFGDGKAASRIVHDYKNALSFLVY